MSFSHSSPALDLLMSQKLLQLLLWIHLLDKKQHRAPFFADLSKAFCFLHIVS